MHPTPIQERAITAALRDRKDILGAAQTVSNKHYCYN
jgi:superfamily II DNA/RNA helicase